MPGVASARVASALVNIRGVRPARSRIPFTSTPNLSRDNNVPVLCILEVVGCGIFEERRVLLELSAEFSVGDELRLLPIIGGWDEGRRAIVSEPDDG
jgi:hypothetical protein